jgi:hypothetical protein
MKKLMIVAGIMFLILLAIASARAATKTPVPSPTPTAGIYIVTFETTTDIINKVCNPKISDKIAQYVIAYKTSYSADKSTAYITAIVRGEYFNLVKQVATRNHEVKITSIVAKPTPTVTRTP